MSTARFIAGVAAIAFVLAGCAAAPNDVPHLSSSSGSPTDQIQPEPAGQARETGMVAPAQVFGGDCDALFSDDEVSTAMGVPVEPLELETSGLGDEAIIEQLGGIQCWWAADTSSGNYAGVWLILFPLGAIEFETPDIPCGHAPWEDDTTVDCYVDQVQNGIRITGLMFGDGPNAANIEPAREELLALFEDRATTAATAPVPIPAAGAWALPWECQAIVSAADFSAVPGLGAGAYGEGLGGRGGPLPLALAYLHGEDDLAGCQIVGEPATVDFVALGGMRWKGEANTPAGATELDVPGLDSVRAIDTGDSFTIEVLDGPNWLEFQVKFTKNAGPIATALVAALEATAVPE